MTQKIEFDSEIDEFFALVRPKMIAKGAEGVEFVLGRLFNKEDKLGFLGGFVTGVVTVLSFQLISTSAVKNFFKVEDLGAQFIKAGGSLLIGYSTGTVVEKVWQGPQTTADVALEAIQKNIKKEGDPEKKKALLDEMKKILNEV